MEVHLSFHGHASHYTARPLIPRFCSILKMSQHVLTCHTALQPHASWGGFSLLMVKKSQPEYKFPVPLP